VIIYYVRLVEIIQRRGLGGTYLRRNTVVVQSIDGRIRKKGEVVNYTRCDCCFVISLPPAWIVFSFQFYIFHLLAIIVELHIVYLLDG
jgi:hypothetical protein